MNCFSSPWSIQCCFGGVNLWVTKLFYIIIITLCVSPSQHPDALVWCTMYCTSVGLTSNILINEVSEEVLFTIAIDLGPPFLFVFVPSYSFVLRSILMSVLCQLTELLGRWENTFWDFDFGVVSASHVSDLICTGARVSHSVANSRLCWKTLYITFQINSKGCIHSRLFCRAFPYRFRYWWKTFYLKLYSRHVMEWKQFRVHVKENHMVRVALYHYVF